MGQDASWVGIEAYTLEGVQKRFLWYRNLTGYWLDNPYDRSNLAILITVIKLEWQVDTAIGPPVALHACDWPTGQISIPPEPGWIGLYVESGRREGFALLSCSSVASEMELISRSAEHFRTVRRAAERLIPDSL
jgi:hypothetical protein